MIFMIHVCLSACLNMITNTKFDISCINLEREADRRMHIDKMLSFANSKYKIFNAVDGCLLLTGKKDITDYIPEYNSNSKPIYLDSLNKLVEQHKWLSPRYYGTTGLKLSHYIMMKELEGSGNKNPLLILEDDADIEAEFVSIIESSLENMMEEWDIILLTPRYWTDQTRPHNPETKLQGMLFFYGTYGIMVNGAKSAKKIADFIEACPHQLPIDDFYGDLSRSGKLIGYAFTKQLVTHLGDLFPSAIQTSYYLGPAHLNISLYHYMNSNK